MSLAAFDPDALLAPVRASAAPPPRNRIPQPWRGGLEILGERDYPAGASEDRWNQIVRDAHAFAWNWGEEAIAAGWTIGNVFGFDLDDTFFRLGLALEIRGGRVVDLWTDRGDKRVATILRPDGSRSYHYRSVPDASRPLWDFRGRL